MKLFTILILATFIGLSGNPVLAGQRAVYTTVNPSSYGPSHNNYNGKVKYGSSTNNYNGFQKYSSAPKTGSPTTSYMSSKQALSAAVPY